MSRLNCHSICNLSKTDGGSSIAGPGLRLPFIMPGEAVIREKLDTFALSLELR
jgi:hypothetical protein